jgi:hypothetical protein
MKHRARVSAQEKENEMQQSPKSQRSHAPGERPSSDNNPTKEIGGQTPEHSGSNTTRVPTHSPGGPNNPGVQSGSSTVPVGSSSAPSGGSAGYVKSDDAQKSGGTPHRFPNGSE